MSAPKPVQFINEVKRETKKVVWPTWPETRVATIMVFIMVAICSLFLFATDQIISVVIKKILGI